MKLWIDDVRPAPEGYKWEVSVNEAKVAILLSENSVTCCQSWIDLLQSPAYNDGVGFEQYIEDWKHRLEKDRIELIDIDHDAGDEAYDGGDFIKLLDWMEQTGRSYPIRIHSMNPVGVENMRRIIQKNGWTEVK